MKELRTEEARIKLYLTLMEEARIRIALINDVYKDRTILGIYFTREICYLQYRFLCEIIALGCLVAHGTFTRKLLDMFEANKIIDEMFKLKNDFYPIPIRTTREIRSDGADLLNIIGISHEKHLTRDELKKLWSKSGDILHRSSLTKFLKNHSKQPALLTDILEWNQKIVTLLNEHMIYLSFDEEANVGRALVIQMQNQETGKPSGSLMTIDLNNATMIASSFIAH